MRFISAALLMSAPLLMLACGSGEDGDATHHHDHTATPTETQSTASPTASNLSVSLDFVPKINGEAFSCSSTYDAVGQSETQYTPIDFKMFISEVFLVDRDGNEVELELEQDGVWQYDNLALLDFEDGSGSCTNGSSVLNESIVGNAPAGDYVGIAFTVGIPFEYNHIDASTAPSPLNVTSMFWSWQSGYKFIRADGLTSELPDGFLLHLGSTQCQGEVGDISECTYENRPRIHLEAFDPSSQKIVVDLGQLFEDSNLDSNTENTAPGCMSSETDPECSPIFEGLGLDFADTENDELGQRFFFVE